ncbi:MAG: heparinase II/III family protein [Rhodospirillales bacterium]|nr:heparinase II/III family protein [Rhodospirillales bacterium]
MLFEPQGIDVRPGFIAGLRRLAYASPFYGYTLMGKTPGRLLGTPPEIIPGNAAAGQALLAGFLIFAGERHPIGAMGATQAHASENWRAHLHGFRWLSDLRAVGTPDARKRARALIETWIDTHSTWISLPWQPDITGERLVSWLTHFGFYAADCPEEFREKVLMEMARQVRHLSRTAANAATGSMRIKALQGLIYSGISIPDCDKYLDQGLRQMEIELKAQILPDGGHNSRSPSLQLQLLGDLVAIREAMIAAHLEQPQWLKDAIRKATPMLRSLRHSDGGLALFNGASVENPSMIDQLLNKTNVRTRTVSSAPHSGFHRLAAGRTTVILDSGPMPSRDANRWGHAGALSFEMSAGRERLIVNCGSTGDRGGEWRDALRSSAAHSTLVVGDLNSTEIDLGSGTRQKPQRVNSSRRELDGSAIVEAVSDGYEQTLGVTHRRILMLAPDGGELHGEDRLTGGGNHVFHARFHLHPNVQATLIQDGHTVLMKPRRGKGWKFIAANHALAVEESIFFESPHQHRRTQQIVLGGLMSAEETVLRWRLLRL